MRGLVTAFRAERDFFQNGLFFTSLNCIFYENYALDSFEKFFSFLVVSPLTKLITMKNIKNTVIYVLLSYNYYSFFCMIRFY